MHDPLQNPNRGASFNYLTLPALAAYITRIGAVELNFRRFMVKEYRGHYYLERALIKIENDGTIKCDTIEHKPTKEEAEAIKLEIADCAAWPRSIFATNLLNLKIPHDNNLYTFWDRTRTHIIMCQQRVDTDDGGKKYIPWTFFSDGQWRSMEPDGKLPFWKPPKTRNKSRIMIHEGAKAAAFTDGLINDPKRRAERAEHPWANELADYEHWGMIGGALVPHRADYSELHAEAPSGEVVYVCDNDFNGESALQKVSKHYGRAMKGIHFGLDFDDGWDMAEPMPPKKFNGKRWTGPTLESLKTFATYATETLPPDSKGGRPLTVLKQCFAEEWIHSVTPDAYIHRDWPNDIMTAQGFDDRVYPFSGTAMTSRLIKGCNAVKSAIIKYVPGEKPGLYGGDGGRYFNTHCPSKIKPEEGDAGPWLGYMEHLIPLETDRIEAERWIATLIARPHIKMMYAMLLISETQGVGKSTLGDRILSPILGQDNVSSPTESEVVDSNYTYWQSHKRLAIIHEIYAGHSSKAYNKLKNIITDRTIDVIQKYLAPYKIDNWLHILACSNNFNALKLTGDDRRWFIPKVTEKKQPEEYWISLNDWLNNKGGLGIIVNWANEFLKTHKSVGRAEAAPWSNAKLTVIEATYSPGMQITSDILNSIKLSVEKCNNKDFARCVLMDTDFVGLIKDNLYDGRNNDYLERPSTIRKIAKTIGWFIGEDYTQFRDGTRGRLICLDAEDASRPPKELFKEVFPSRIRLLGKQLLVIEQTGISNFFRDQLDDDDYLSDAQKREREMRQEERERAKRERQEERERAKREEERKQGKE